MAEGGTTAGATTAGGMAVVAAVPKRKVGFDAEVPPAKAAAGATPGLPFYSTATGSRRYVRRSRRRRLRASAA